MCSDHLNERHPYQDLPFKDSYTPKDVRESSLVPLAGFSASLKPTLTLNL